MSSTVADHPSPTAAGGGSTVRSLKSRAALGGLWTFSGHFASLAIRLAGNLVLTRLLFPEYFGLMAIVQIFLTGLQMFSDIGITPSIIQNERGNEPRFLNTAWTAQCMRGFALWTVCSLLAWPLAKFYEQPILMYIMPVTGFTAVIAGFNSTNLASARRKLSLARLTLLELSSQSVGLLATIAFAWKYQSVWSLVAGGLVTASTKMMLSHTALPGISNRFTWDREAFDEMFRFGRWIFVTSVLGFLVTQGDRLILGKLTSIEFVGIYTIAFFLTRACGEAIDKISVGVLFPSFAELHRDRPERLYTNLRKCRLILIAANWMCSLFFILFGQQVIDLLYDPRYASAGWMLELLPLGGLVGVVNYTYTNAVLAVGQSRIVALLMATRIAVQLIAMTLGAHWGGELGVVLGASVVGLLLFPFNAFVMQRLGIWQPEVDLPVLAAALLVSAGYFQFLW